MLPKKHIGLLGPGCCNLRCDTGEVKLLGEKEERKRQIILLKI